MKDNKNEETKNIGSYIPESMIILGSILISIGFLIIISTSHWGLSLAIVCVISGIGFIIFGHYKAKITKGYDKGMKKAIAVGISLILISLILGVIYAEKFDVTYRISISVNPNNIGDYRVILPLPSDPNGEPQYIFEYKSDDMKIIDTEHGKGLEINTTKAFTFSCNGRDGELKLRDFSLGIGQQEIDSYFWIFLYTEGNNVSYGISIEYENDAPGEGYNGEINCYLTGNGWNKTVGMNKKWVA